MNINNLYIGVYKETNNESLFYKVNKNIYRDIKNHSRKVSGSELDISSLIPYTTIDRTNKSKTRFKALKIYNHDRMEEMSLNRVFIGDILQVTEILKKEYGRGFTIHTRFNTTTVKAERLLLATNKDLESSYFIDLESNLVYSNPYSPHYGDYYISTKSEHLKLASQVFNISNTTIEKGKLLKKYREYKKNNQ